MEDDPVEPTRVSILSTKGFSIAIENYIDENKPDPLSLKQLRELSLHWEDHEDALSFRSCPFHPSYVLQGSLRLGGEYLAVTLKVFCAWSSDSTSPRHGSFFYSCHASARFWEKEEFEKQNPQDDSKAKKTRKKIRSKMIQRLRKDAYIVKILCDVKDDKRNKETGLVAQAKIKVSENNLEERVNIAEDICESIKRAVWSSAETTLDVAELFILSFPSLPTTSHSNTVITANTLLANRARLRLLEDAMIDACEQEGEDQILEDLTIDSIKQQQEEDRPSSAGNQTSSKNEFNSRKKVRS
jgi:hypothetical protein